MRTETFNEISFSDESKFDRKNGKIQLKEYRDNLIFYDPFDITIDPTFCSGDKTAIPATQDYEIMNFGVFAQHVVNRTTIKFDSSNFYSLKDEGSIQVRIRADFSNGYVYQEFLSNQVTLADGVYDFTLKLNTTSYLVSVELSHSDTLADIASAISLYFYDNSIQAGAMIVNGNLRITTYSVEDTLEVSEGEELSLLQALGGIGKVKVLNKPAQDITFLSLKNSTDNKNRIDLVHTKNGDLVLLMYDNNESLKINKNFGNFKLTNLDFTAFELAWNKNFAQVFIDGKLLDIAITNFIRDGSGDLYLTGTSTNPYKFDELIIYNKQKHFVDYIPTTFALTKYSVELPYIDINFGNNITQESLASIDLSCSNNCHFVVQLGTQFYYYLSDAWYFSDGSFSQSMDKDTFVKNIGTLYISNNVNFLIRIYFESDGLTPCYLDEINITETESSDAPARIIGVMDLSNPVDFSNGNYNIKITTGLGSKIVDLTTFSSDKSKVTLEEIKKSIDTAKVPDLNKAYDDGNYHIVLETITKGKDAYLKVENAEGIAVSEDINISYKNEDENGIYTTIEYMNLNNIVVKRSVLMGGVSPKYINRYIYYYDNLGKPLETKVYTLVYDDDNNIIEEVLNG